MTLRAMKRERLCSCKPFRTGSAGRDQPGLERDRTRKEEQAQFSVLRSRLENLASREREVSFDITLLTIMASRLAAADTHCTRCSTRSSNLLSRLLSAIPVFVYVLENDELVLRAPRIRIRNWSDD